jgi:hypothetical protein
MSVSRVSAAGDGSDSPTPDPGAIHIVARGDTLWRIAERLRGAGAGRSTAELVAALVRLNPSIRDPDRIEIGQPLRLPCEPPRPRAAAERARPPARARSAVADMRIPRGSGSTDAPAASPDGTPCFRQSDAAWRDVRLGARGPTLARAGCAVTACAMAMSKLTGTEVRPDELVARLDGRGGLDAAGRLVWTRAAEEMGVRVADPRQPWSLERIRGELAAGRPVVVGVYKGGGPADGEPAHWICLTRHDAATETFWANDPATGKPIALGVDAGSGSLVTSAGAGVAYRSAQRMVTFRPQVST